MLWQRQWHYCHADTALVRRRADWACSSFIMEMPELCFHMEVGVIRRIIEFMVKNLYGKNILAQFSKIKLQDHVKGSISCLFSYPLPCSHPRKPTVTHLLRSKRLFIRLLGLLTSCVSKSSALQLLVTITWLCMKQLLFYCGAHVTFVHHWNMILMPPSIQFCGPKAAGPEDAFQWGQAGSNDLSCRFFLVCMALHSENEHPHMRPSLVQECYAEDGGNPLLGGALCRQWWG